MLMNKKCPAAVKASGFLCLAWLSTTQAAEAGWADLPESVEPGMDLSADYAKQRFADTDGDYTTVTPSPYLRWGDGWEARLDVPWRQASGEYIVPGATPRITQLCSQVAAHPRAVQNLLDNGRITQAQLDICNNLVSSKKTTEVSGAGDVILWLNRLVPLNNTWALLPQMGYKHDSGEVEDGLGSGTRDAMLEIGLSGQFQQLTVYLMGGYNRVLAQPDSSTLDDYPYAACEAEWALVPAVGVSARYDYESAQAEYLEDLQSVTGALSWHFLENYSTRIYLQSYKESEGYPQQEAGISINATF